MLWEVNHAVIHTKILQTACRSVHSLGAVAPDGVPKGIQFANAYTGADRNGGSDADTHAHTDTDAHTHAYPNADADTYADPNADADTDADSRLDRRQV